MKVRDIRLVGIRCFEDTGEIQLAPRRNVIVGHNNAGKTTLLKAITNWQGGGTFQGGLDGDIRPGVETAFQEMLATDLVRNPSTGTSPPATTRFVRQYLGNSPDYHDHPVWTEGRGQVFTTQRPHHLIVPYSSARKTAGFKQNVDIASQAEVDGTHSNLYSRIDMLATAGHPKHDAFMSMVRDLVGLPITTRASQGGKVAGFYLNQDRFVTLERMGDGVTEMVALVVDLTLEENKVFVLEEPETNLHPQAIKSLMELIRISSSQNQFVVATHSNIVARELGVGEGCKIFRVYRKGPDPMSPSRVTEVVTPSDHRNLLEELGYEFADLQLHDAWLFLEESSAETVISQILIPLFCPKLQGRLRTYSAAGISNVEPAVTEFQRLVVFVHLQPAYEGKLWIRTDGDDIGKDTIESLKAKFPYLDDAHAATFSKSMFEHFYPAPFSSEVQRVAEIANKEDRRQAKAALLMSVLEWTRDNETAAREAWAASAEEPIRVLGLIKESIG